MRFLLIIVSLCVMSVSAAEKPRVNTADYDWIDGETLQIDGRGFNEPGEAYIRVPKRFQGKVPASISGMGRQSTGMSIRFRTTSKNLVVRWKVRQAEWTDPLIPPTGLQSVSLWYKVDAEWVFLKSPHPRKDGDNEMLISWSPAREGILYLPTRAQVLKLEIGLDKGAKFEQPARKNADRIVHYGTSIVHGGCVSQPGLMFTSFASRITGREIVNLGFSGSGKMEPEMADLLAELDCALYILDCDWNMSVELQQERYEAFVRKLHKLRPNTPILLCGGCVERKTPRQQEVFTKSVYDKLKAEDPTQWKDLHFLSGVGQLPFESYATHDHCHPNDFGAQYMGRVYADKILTIISGQ